LCIRNATVNACSRHRSYFSAYALQHFYLPSPVHSKYINLEVLKRYLPVGGVRIEDDLLITSKGYENLTTAPKGDAMLEIIKQGNSTSIPSSSPRPSLRARISEEEPPRLRAPGISTDQPESILRPIARAATMPAEYRHKSVEFEPFDGPSLFSNFKRSMTTDERIQRWQQDRDSALTSKVLPTTSGQSNTICGSDMQGVKHVYMTSGSHRVLPLHSSYLQNALPTCKKCTILCEALDRLRQNLAMSEQSSPRQEHATVSCGVNSTSEHAARQEGADQAYPEQRKRRSVHQLNPNTRPLPATFPEHDREAPRFQRALDRSSNHTQHLEQDLSALSLQSPHHSQERSSHTSEAQASEHHIKKPYPSRHRQQLDKLVNEQQHAIESQSRLRPGDQARAQQTLLDLRVQRSNNTAPERIGCQFDNELGNGPYPDTLYKEFRATAPKPVVDRPDQMRG
jgi:hypothetical protein